MPPKKGNRKHTMIVMTPAFLGPPALAGRFLTTAPPGKPESITENLKKQS